MIFFENPAEIFFQEHLKETNENTSETCRLWRKRSLC